MLDDISQFAPNSWYLLLKYRGSASTAAYGLYATVNDLSSKKDGRTTLSRKGRIGLAWLAVSAALSLGADAAKDRHELVEKAAADKRYQEDRRQLQLQLEEQISRLKVQQKASKRIAGDLRSVSDQLQASAQISERTLELARHAVLPIKDAEISFELVFPEDVDDVASYRSSLRDALSAHSKDRGLQALPQAEQETFIARRDGSLSPTKLHHSLTADLID